MIRKSWLRLTVIDSNGDSAFVRRRCFFLILLLAVAQSACREDPLPPTPQPPTLAKLVIKSTTEAYVGEPVLVELLSAGNEVPDDDRLDLISGDEL